MSSVTDISLTDIEKQVKDMEQHIKYTVSEKDCTIFLFFF